MLVTWKLRDSPRRLISKGLRPVMSSPLSRISPALSAKRPLIRLNSVDLPAPFGPMTAWRSPRRDREIDAADDRGRAEALVNVAELERRRAHRARLFAAPATQRAATRGPTRRSAEETDGDEGEAHDPGRRAAGVEDDAEQLHDRAELGPDRQAVVDLDERDRADREDGRRDESDGVGRGEAMQQPGPGERGVHQDEPDQPVRGEQGDEDEEEAEIEQPRLGVVAERDLQEGHEHGADDRPEERADAADIGHQQHERRALRAEAVERHELVIDREQPAGDARRRSSTPRRR